MKLRGEKTYWLGVASSHFAKRQNGNDEGLYDIHNNPNFLQLSYPFQLFTIIVIEFETRTFLRPQSPRMDWPIQVSHHPWDIVAIESFLNLIMLETLGPLKGAFSVGAQASCDLSSLVRAAPASSPPIWDFIMIYFIQHRVLINSVSPTPKHERQETI
jgi:hypothetical protein